MQYAVLHAGCELHVLLVAKGGTMDFGNAVRELKCGKEVARAGWNGKDVLVPRSR